MSLGLIRHFILMTNTKIYLESVCSPGEKCWKLIQTMASIPNKSFILKWLLLEAISYELMFNVDERVIFTLFEKLRPFLILLMVFCFLVSVIVLSEAVALQKIKPGWRIKKLVNNSFFSCHRKCKAQGSCLSSETILPFYINFAISIN